MLYKFRIVSDEVENFKLEILIDSDDTFMRLRNAIMDAVGYDKSQLDSFFICDDDWTRREEVTLMEMDTDSDEEVYLMEDTPLSELIEDAGQKFMFVFDYVTGRAFFMEMKEIITGKVLHDPLCQRKEGKAPVQLMDIDTFDKSVDKAEAQYSDIDEEFYGDQGYNDDELSSLDGIDGEDI